MAVYRHFQAGRTVFYAALAGVILSAAVLCPPARAADDRYTIENVEVDVTAANAVQAREKALEEAQMKAYRMLAEKAYGAEAMANFQDPDPLLVSAMVQDFEVTNEQISKVRYKGVFTVRFRPNAVRQYLPANDYAAGTEDITAPAAAPTLILPYFQAGQRTVLWDEANTWLKAWAAEGATATEDKNLIVPIGDLLDVSQMPDDKALTYDSKMLSQMMGRYGAREAAILIGILKDDEMEISIYQALPTGPQYAQTLVIQRMASEEPAALQARAADRLRKVMAGQWKYSPAAPAPAAVTDAPPAQETDVLPPTLNAGPMQTFQGRVVFTTVQEWVRLKNQMERAPGVQAVMVRGLKPREAQVDVNFAGDAVQLATALQQAGVVMRTPVNQSMGYGAAGLYEFSAGAVRY